MEQLCKLLKEYYKKDYWVPGVVVSYLGEKSKEKGLPWYASIARLPDRMGKRIIIKKAYGINMNNAIESLKDMWMRHIEEEKNA